MPEEMRFFLRTAIYTALIGTIYWLVSYEWAGTVLLASLLGASIFFIAAGSALYRTARREAASGGAGNGDLGGRSSEVDGPGRAPTDGDATPRRGSLLRRAVGFDAPGEDPGAPLELAEQVFPTASLWPLAAALAATLVGLGALYGPWLWIPGASLGIATGTAWLTQLRP